MSYPATVSYFVRKLAAHTTNIYKLEPNGTPGSKDSGLGSGSIITFELPSNTLLDFSSIQLWFNAKTTGANSRLPNNISSLIERYSLECGGQTIAQGFSGYNLVKNVKDYLTKEQVGSGYHKPFGHYRMSRAIYSVNGGPITAADPQDYSSDNSVETPFCIDEWVGFLGECKPSIIDTSLLGSLTLKFYLAGDSVLSQSGGNGVGTTTVGSITPTRNVLRYQRRRVRRSH